MQLKHLRRQETFEKLFASHRRDNTDTPLLPETTQYIDIRRYLTASDIKADETNFVIHEQSLASVVSLKTPPQNFITADTMRYLTCRGDLNFPHTIVLDFVALDTEASKKELKKKIKRIEGSGNTFFGLKPLQEDAKVVREELTELLRQVEKGREKICKARINFIVFGGKPRNRTELNEKTETLTERCERMISAVRKIPVRMPCAKNRHGNGQYIRECLPESFRDEKPDKSSAKRQAALRHSFRPKARGKAARVRTACFNARRSDVRTRFI